MGHTLAGDAVDDAMEFDRIGRRQRAVHLAGRRDHPDGADPGRVRSGRPRPSHLRSSFAFG